MFNGKRNWRAGIVGLASLALLATFPLSAVTASAETVEPTPAGTVEHAVSSYPSKSVVQKLSALSQTSPSKVSPVKRAATGSSGFRSAGHVRSSGSGKFSSLLPRPSVGAWLVGTHGEVQHITTVSDGNRLVRVVRSHDFPLGKFCWKADDGTNPDSVVVKSNGKKFVPSFTRASAGPGKFDGFSQNKDYIYLTASHELDNGANTGWGATVVRLDKRTNKWEYNARGQWKKISWPDGFYNDAPKVGRCYNPSAHLDQEGHSTENTVSYYAGNVTSGALLADGTYIFGGVAKMPQKSNGKFVAHNKVFALKKTGEVLYLGYFDTALQSGFSLDGNYIVSKDGDLYSSYGVPDRRDNTYKVNIDKISKAELDRRINTPVAVYDSKSSQWKTRSGASFNQMADDFRGQGQSNNPIPVTKALDQKAFHPSQEPASFAAFDISPEGNFVIFSENDTRVVQNGLQGQVPKSTIEEFNIDTGRPIRTIPPYTATEREGDAWRNGFGSTMPTITDGMGTLLQAPPRKLNLFKEVVHRKGNDQFKLDLNPLNSPFNQGDTYRIKEAETAFTSSSQTVQIRDTLSIPGSYFRARVAERAANGASKDHYVTELKCSDGVRVGNKTDRDDNRYFDIEVPFTVESPINCTMVNTGPKPPMNRVTVYKHFDDRLYENDQFTVKLRLPDGDETVKKTTSDSKVNWDNLLIGKDAPVGEQITVSETMDGLDHLPKYNTTIQCYLNDRRGKLLKKQTFTGAQSRSMNLTLPTDLKRTDTVRCYVDNEIRKNIVEVYKTFDKRYNPDDEFMVQLTLPSGETKRKSTNSKDQGKEAAATVEGLVAPGQKFTVSEAKSGTTDLANYDNQINCYLNEEGGTLLRTKSNPLEMIMRKDLGNSDKIVCVIHNTRHIKGSMLIHKVSKQGGLDLAGSEWKICKIPSTHAPNDNKCYYVADNNKTNVGPISGSSDEKVADEDPRDGYIKISELEECDYKIQETKAPVGFLLDPTTRKEHINCNDPDPKVVTITNEQATVPTLPLTGGLGTLPYMILGFVLTGGAVVAFVIAKPKNTKPSHK